MDTIDFTYNACQLLGQQCALNHGTINRSGRCNDGSTTKSRIAINALVIPIGTINKDIEVVKRELVIPICQDCMDAMEDDTWFLYYCTECGNSAWCIRELSSKFYNGTAKIVPFRYCDDCFDKEWGVLENKRKGESK